jgi:hypothetical protein
MAESPRSAPTVDPVELVAALLQRRGARPCVDLRTGEVHRPIEECDPDEDDRKFEDRARYAPIDPLEADSVAAFWERVGIDPGAGGLYQPLSAACGPDRARLLEIVREVATEWLAARGIDATVRRRE